MLISHLLLLLSDRRINVFNVKSPIRKFFNFIMKKIFFLVVSMLTATLTLLGQELQQNDFRYYHKAKYDAEFFIQKKEYKQAIDVFEKLKECYPHCFHTELYNLSICYLKEGMADKAIDIAKQLVLQGYTLDNFSKYKEYAKIMGTDLWQTMETNYQVYREFYCNSVDSCFLRLIDTLYVTDQKAASEGTDSVINSVYYTQGLLLLGTIKSGGYPDFFVNNEQVHAIRLTTMLRHFFYNGIGNTDTVALKANKSIIIQAIKDGKFLPEYYTLIFKDNDIGTLSVCYNYDTEKATLIVNSLGGVTLEKANQRRRALGLYEIDTSNTGLLEGSWYSKVPIDQMKKAMLNCDSCETFKEYMAVVLPIREKVRDLYKVKDFDEFVLHYDLNNIMSSWHKNSNKYMKNYKCRQ